MFVAMKLIKEMETQTNYFPQIPSKIQFKTEDGMIGVIPVFETREQAEAYADGARVVGIELVT